VGSLSDDDGREKMLLLKKKEMFPTEMGIESKGKLGTHTFF
jgi:hypothetical protein